MRHFMVKLEVEGRLQGGRREEGVLVAEGCGVAAGEDEDVLERMAVTSAWQREWAQARTVPHGVWGGRHHHL